MSSSKDRFIAHIDMDAFFASIEERDRPALRGKPVVVGADPREGRGRGVVSTCSYEARKYGIHSAMPISQAFRKCPDAVFLPVDMEKYGRISDEIYEILYSFSPDIEPVSIDEAFLDITGSYRLFGRLPIEACRLIKARIAQSTGLTASIGLAPTKMAAKIASDLDKPDGLVEVARDGLQDFLRPLEVRRIWGLGKKCEDALRRLGIRTIGELADADPERLAALLGKAGSQFWRLAHGIDDSKVESAGEAKSISNEMTFDVDTIEDQKVEGVILSLCEKVSFRLRRHGLKARTLTLKIRLADFSTFTRAVTIGSATNFIDILYKEIRTLYKNFNKKTKKVRLVGVKASGFCPADFPDSLFKEAGDKRCEATHKALDRIKQRFGDDSIFIAGSKK
ncbi:MAG: DNA polymerase IV [Candidatus Omnitrophica bacterium]|nr:DNA polymerase IV [Candidatus Omnitrophota bacterium]